MELSTNSQEFKSLIDEVVNYIEKKPTKKWIEQEEVEATYSIKLTQLWELRKAGLIKYKKLGAKVLINVSSLEAFLNE